MKAAEAARVWRRAAASACGLAVVAASLLGGWAGGPGVPAASAAVPAPTASPAKPAANVAVPLTAAGLESRYATQVRPLMLKYCGACHANGKHKGEMSLDPYTSLVSVQSAHDAWLHVGEVMKQKTMPPEEKPQPTAAEMSAMLGWISDALAFCDCTGPRDPGRVSIHRLNRTEYNNTLRDLLGVDLKPAKDFPADDTGYGFDNIADVLTMSPLLAEKYLAAAEAAMEKVAPAENPNKPQVKRLAEADLKATGEKNTALFLSQPGDTAWSHAFPIDGTYEVRVRGYQRKVEKEEARVELHLEGRTVGSADMVGSREKSATVKMRFPVKAGTHKLALSLTNPKTIDNPTNKKNKTTRSVTIDWIEVEGPFDAAPPPPSAGYKRIFIAKPNAGVTDEVAAKAVLQRFATRAYRRPAQADEVESLMKVYRSAKADGENYEQGVRYAITAVLVSPQFLFRIEIDPPAAAAPPSAVVTPNAVALAAKPAVSAAAPQPYLISDYELATRLSYFLWSSTPDDELMGLAGAKRLRDPAVLAAQVKRMLQDPRSASLVQNFAGQWLELRNLEDYKPDVAFYPSWDDSLKAAMKRETELFIGNVIREDRPILDLLNGDYTYVNERLAKHYGIANVKGDEFRRVSLAGTKRGGILTQASVLTVTAMPTRTSPVKRGKFVLENILGTPPPPPPPDVPALSENSKDISKATLKVRLEAHRKDPNCAVCHIRMDAIGFSLENFDAIGQWRDKDGTFPVDSVGKLPEGNSLNGADGLRQMLLARQGDFVTTVVKKMLTYSLGRGLEYYDQCTVKDVEQAVRQDGYKFSSLVLAVVKSDAFQKRRLLRPEEIRARQEKTDDQRDKK